MLASKGLPSGRVWTPLALVSFAIGGSTGLGVASRDAAATATARLTFLVEAPPSTPPGASLWISGNVPALGSWNGAGIRLDSLGGGRFAATVALAVGTALEFKVTRGSWETVEKGPAGE